MHWITKDITTTAAQYWLVAQGVPSNMHRYWRDKTLFSQVPPLCQICGIPWRPDKDLYVALWWTIIETTFGPKWFNGQLGLVRDTGHLDSHPRFVCCDCGEWPGTAVVDCFTAEKITLRPRKTGMREALRKCVADIKYWTTTMLKFMRLWLEHFASFARHPKHFIECRKMIFKWLSPRSTIYTAFKMH